MGVEGEHSKPLVPARKGQSQELLYGPQHGGTPMEHMPSQMPERGCVGGCGCVQSEVRENLQSRASGRRQESKDYTST